MIYIIQCTKCGAQCHVRGTYEYDTDALELDDRHSWEWSNENMDMKCDHEDYEVIDEFYEPFPGDII